MLIADVDAVDCVEQELLFSSIATGGKFA